MTVKRQLAQIRPSGTTAVNLFTLSSSANYVIDSIMIANLDGNSVNVSVFHDVDGTTYNETTAVIHEVAIHNPRYIKLEGPFYGYSSAENWGCQCSVADGATFTVYGYIAGERL